MYLNAQIFLLSNQNIKLNFQIVLDIIQAIQFYWRN